MQADEPKRKRHQKW